MDIRIFAQLLIYKAVAGCLLTDLYGSNSLPLAQSQLPVILESSMRCERAFVGGAIVTISA